MPSMECQLVSHTTPCSRNKGYNLTLWRETHLEKLIWFSIWVSSSGMVRAWPRPLSSQKVSFSVLMQTPLGPKTEIKALPPS